MEYRIRVATSPNQLAAIDAELRRLDPAALADVDRLQGQLRVAAHLETTDVIGVLARAGLAVQPGDIAQLPSICCGGCGG